MRAGVEQTWVSWLDSPAWRWFGRSPAGRRLFASPAFRIADNARRAHQAARSRALRPGAFASVRTFCVFLGTVKSGGSLLGALLDAHPDVVLADEADALRYVAAGFDRQQLFHVLARTARREAMKGRVTARRLAPYSLAVPGQWQGRCTDPVVLGDSRAGPTTRQLGDRPELLGRLQTLLGPVQDRYIHVVRHPCDPISAMVLRGRRSLDDAVDDYAGQCRRLRHLRGRLPADRLLTLRYEDLVAAPAAQLDQVCGFLGVDAPADYLRACVRLVDPARPGEREQVAWTPQARAAVAALTRQFPFLDSYADEGGPHARR